jgi:NADPH:quinone reductase-like Zn-dependent oxidoreductase
LKAVRFHRFGGPEVLAVEEVPDPQPGPDDVVLRVTACALNHIDVDIRAGTSRLPIPLPFTPGGECVGEIESLGSAVSGWERGERVLPYLIVSSGSCRFCRTGREHLCVAKAITSMNPDCGWSEQLVCGAGQLLRAPARLGDESAAALQGAFGTAWHMLFTRGGLRAGETVLIDSVASGIGSAALQLAKVAGAFTIGTASSEAKLARAAELGLDVGIDHTREDVVAVVRGATRGHGADLVFEHVGGDHFRRGLESLAVDGRLVVCGAHTGEVVPFDVVALFRTEKRVIGAFAYTRAEAERCIELAERGVIEPIVDSVFPLAEAARAMERLESREHFGKIVLIP